MPNLPVLSSQRRAWLFGLTLVVLFFFQGHAHGTCPDEGLLLHPRSFFTAAIAWPLKQLGYVVRSVLKHPLPFLLKILAAQGEIKVPLMGASTLDLGHPPHINTTLCPGRMIPGSQVKEMVGLLSACTDHVCLMYRGEHCSMAYSSIAASVFGECFDDPCGFSLGILSTIQVRDKIAVCKREVCKRRTRRFSGLHCVRLLDTWAANVCFDDMFCANYALNRCKPRLDNADLLVWGAPLCNYDICPGKVVPDDGMWDALRQRYACLFYACTYNP